MDKLNRTLNYVQITQKKKEKRNRVIKIREEKNRTQIIKIGPNPNISIITLDVNVLNIPKSEIVRWT